MEAGESGERSTTSAAEHLNRTSRTLTEDERERDFLGEGDKGVPGRLLKLDVAELLDKVADGNGDAGFGERRRLGREDGHHAVNPR
jgi:hypothetical protein